MFDIGFSELLVVFVVGLIILGPERLPTAAKTAGLWVRKIKRSIQSVQSEINAQLDQEEMQRKIKETNERIMRESAQLEQSMSSPVPGQTEVPKPVQEESAAPVSSAVTQPASDAKIAENTAATEQPSPRA
ncbi:twin-arginine translocase subunit TatB [Maribrevibacterium harenarium]|uniref:Sec-independent protein translocase protein TatB n=1 Tax=Maribrevibacterium harenarium TaxID=2589817 RepID=A0A501X182_9GAMM|nr:Sec-independent protein translocase protein TatB [Maribrevibacterium harenarium]TPE54331.1 twin-arginine translocase subunit TatB [Maribrevibacterium harenarium]